jgi:ABC-type proline/glycine betaine transport system permease subunit
MVIFILCLVEFLLAPQAATSTFFLVMVATAIDVVAGFTIGIRVAQRDLNLGTSS